MKYPTNILLTTLCVIIQMVNCNLYVNVNFTTPFKKCLTALIKDNFSDRSTLMYIYEDIEDVYIPYARVYPQVLIDANNPANLLTFLRSNNIINLKSYDALNNTLFEINKSNSHNLRTKYIIVLKEKLNFKIILEILCQFDIVKVIIITVDENEENVKLYGSSSCLNGFWTRTEINTKSTNNGCDRIFAKLLLNQELHNLNGRNLNLHLHRHRAFPTLVDPYLKPHPGVLISFVKLIGERTKATVNIIDEQLTDDAVISQRGKHINLTYLLARATDYFDDVEMSDLIYQDPVVWIVPKAPYVSTVKLFATLFAEKIWTAVILVFFVTSIIWYLLARIVNDSSFRISFAQSILSTFSLLVNVPNHTLPKSKPLRILISFYMLFCMNICVMFQTIMISLLLDPRREPAINTLENMLSSGFTPIITKLAYRQLNTSDHKISKHILAKCRISTENITQNLLNVVEYKNQSTHIGAELLSMYNKERDMVDIIESFNGGLLDIELNVAIRKGHPFLFTINKFIDYVVEHGIMEKLFNNVGKFKYTQIIEHENSAITIKHIKVMFISWGFGLTVSVLILILELIVQVIKKKM